jgi:cyclic pyranopterin phosphate synthase
MHNKDSQLVLDQFARPLQELRVSVTDRCNFRCVYCMPKEIFHDHYTYLERSEILSFEEITRMVRIFVDLGVRKVRLTGGEPLIRRDLDGLIRMLAAVDKLEQLTLTTNGALLTAQRAQSLYEAGLHRINISLDAIDDAAFKRCNDVDFPVTRVLDAIGNAVAAGLAPIKINMAVQKGLNDDQILPMAEHFRGSGQILRFIEFMDVGTLNGWRPEDVITADQIIEQIHARYPLEAMDPAGAGDVAKRWRYQDGEGEIGVIASVSQPFCGGCNRARLSAEGGFYSCLFATEGSDFRPMLRGRHSDEEIAAKLRQIWGGRVDRYSELRAEGTDRPRIQMSYIGG